MTPDQYCQDKAVHAGSSLYYALLFVPAEKRRALIALYALRRQLADAVAQASDASVARIQLAWWRTELAKLFIGQAAPHPVLQALAPHLQTGGMTEARLLALADGMEMELDQTRYLDFTGLGKYCGLVSGTLCELVAGVLGHADAATLRHAEKLGLALQLARIIRDVGRDARLGRIYLPVNEMQQFNVKAADVLNARHTEESAALLRFQCERARAIFAEAMALLPKADRRAQRHGAILAALHLALLDEIESDGFQVLNQRVSLTPLRKLWVAWKTNLTGRV